MFIRNDNCHLELWGASSVVVHLQRRGRPCFTQVNCHAELYWPTFYIQFSHITPRSRMVNPTAISRSTARTCWLNCVKVVGRVSRVEMGNSSSHPTCVMQLSSSGQPERRSCGSEVNGFTSGWRNWGQGRGNLKELASHCTNVHWI